MHYDHHEEEDRKRRMAQAEMEGKRRKNSDQMNP